MGAMSVDRQVRPLLSKYFSRSNLNSLRHCPAVLKEKYVPKFFLHDNVLMLSIMGSEEESRVNAFLAGSENAYPYLFTSNATLASSCIMEIKTKGLSVSGMVLQSLAYVFCMHNKSSICLENMIIKLPEVVCGLSSYSIGLMYLVGFGSACSDEKMLEDMENLIQNSFQKWNAR